MIPARWENIGAKQMDEPIVIERTGLLELQVQGAGGGDTDSSIEIVNRRTNTSENLDGIIGRAVGLPMPYAGGAPAFSGAVGHCELVLRIWPTENVKKQATS